MKRCAVLILGGVGIYIAGVAIKYTQIYLSPVDPSFETFKTEISTITLERLTELMPDRIEQLDLSRLDTLTSEQVEFLASVSNFTVAFLWFQMPLASGIRQLQHQLGNRVKIEAFIELHNTVQRVRVL